MSRNLGPTIHRPLPHYLDTPRCLQSLHPGTKPTHPHTSMNGSAPKHSSSTPASLELRNSIYQTTSKVTRPINATEASNLANGASSSLSNGGIPNIAYACDTCGTDCTPVRYHSLKVK